MIVRGVDRWIRVGVKLHRHESGVVWRCEVDGEAEIVTTCWFCVVEEEGPVWGYEEGEAVAVGGLFERVDDEVETGGEVREFSGGLFAEEEGLAVDGSARAAVLLLVFPAFGEAEESALEKSITFCGYDGVVTATEAGETEV